MDRIWSYVFIVSIAQCLFIGVLLFKKKERSSSFYLLTGLLSTLLITNLDFYIVSSGLYRYTPHFFNISMGMMFLFGPLFYFYVRSSMDADFRWRPVYIVHFIPYLLNVALNYQFYAANGEMKIFFIEAYLKGQLDLRIMDKVLVGVQTVHLATYLYFSVIIIKQIRRKYNDTPFIISVDDRKRWLYLLIKGLGIYCVAIAGLLLIVLFTRTLYPSVNYAYTLLTSAGIYLIAYKVIMDPAAVNPHFQQKYKTSQTLVKDLERSCLEKIAVLMEQDKVYKDPDLKVETLAKQLGISPNQLSRLINERFGKSFTDYINEYRVKEFIELIYQKKYFSHTLFGLATEVGFNSKSTFNTSFKKMTGKTPSEFKKQVS